MTSWSVSGIAFSRLAAIQVCCDKVPLTQQRFVGVVEPRNRLTARHWYYFKYHNPKLSLQPVEFKPKSIPTPTDKHQKSVQTFNPARPLTGHTEKNCRFSFDWLTPPSSFFGTNFPTSPPFAAFNAAGLFTNITSCERVLARNLQLKPRFCIISARQ